eukprot:gene16199-16376_t
MREVNLSGVDLNLLPVLDALLRRRNVTRAAEDVGLSQPAMSRALSRLRDVLGDPLLVRGRGGLVLTPRAQALAPKLEESLASLKGLYVTPEFDPQAVRRTVRLAATDAYTVLLAPVVQRRLEREAPGVTVKVESVGPEIVAQVENGHIDLTFGVANLPLPPGARSETLGRDRLAVVMRRGHPTANRAFRLEDYAAFDHVGVTMLGDGQSDLDAVLAAHGIARRMALTTPHFTAALAAVARTDLVTTLSRAFTQPFATHFDLRLTDPPFEQTELELTMIWNGMRGG